MIHLFDERPADHQYIEETTLSEKLNYCSCFTTEASADDGLPQFICMSCSILIGNAYQLKNLCAKTEAKLHELQQLSVAQKAFETEQLQSNTPNVQIDQGVSYFNELNEHSANANSDAKHVNSSTQFLVNMELQEDMDLIEVDDTSAREQFPHKHVKPQTNIEAQSNRNGSSKSAYQCERCCKWFRIKTSLAIHMRSHTNERPYTCEVPFSFQKLLRNFHESNGRQCQ